MSAEAQVSRAGFSHLLARFFVAFAAFGALAPLAVVFYEHRVRWLPINLVLALWPSAMILLPTPSRPSAILLNAASLALNALIYGALGILIGLLVRAASSSSD